MDTSHDPILNEIVSRIVAAVKPDRIILFGSRARGEHGSNSDYDLLVIKDDAEHRRRLAQRLYLELYGIPAGVDVIVETTEHLERVKNLPGTFYADALKEGIVVHG